MHKIRKQKRHNIINANDYDWKLSYNVVGHFLMSEITAPELLERAELRNEHFFKSEVVQFKFIYAKAC